MQDAQWFAAQFERLQRNVETFIRGKSNVVHLALVCMLSEGHLLLDDVPGLGKTSLARAIANSIDGSMGRIQFTPDLLPSDVTGSMVYDMQDRQFEFRPGPVFHNIVIADEINRASPKTQSALLEVMEEKSVTLDGQTFRPPRPFVVIATQNPIEMEGTYPLPESQVDRFTFRTGMGYPDKVSEAEIVEARAAGRQVSDVGPVLDLDTVTQMMAMVPTVFVAPSLIRYAVELASATRGRDGVRLGVSPRGSGALIVAAKAFAASTGSPFVTADHVKILVPFVFGHRLLLTADAEMGGQTVGGLVREVLNEVRVPDQPSVG